MKRPASQYYWGDWRSDAALQSCSLAARGLWHEMNCIMHDCEPYGHLVIGGRPMQAPQLARLVGVSPRECTALLAELEEAGVFSRTADGAVFSRRMVRDERVRNARADGGKAGSEHGAKGASHGIKGGRPKKPKGGFEGGLETPLSGAEKPPPSSSSSSSSSASSCEEAGGKPPNPQRAALPDWLDADVWDAWRRHRRAIRKPMTVDAEALGLRELAKLRDAGHDPRAVVENAILRGWQGLYAPSPDPARPARPQRETVEEHNRRTAEEWLARTADEGRTIDV